VSFEPARRCYEASSDRGLMRRDSLTGGRVAEREVNFLFQTCRTRIKRFGRYECEGFRPRRLHVPAR
jgi:hypothetical protein